MGTMWPYYMQLKYDYELSDTVHFFIYMQSQHIFVFITGNLIAYIFYRFKFEIIERERVNPEIPWPWESDPE